MSTGKEFQPQDFRQYLGQLYQQDFRRLFATLVRVLNDFDLAEDLLQEAFEAASRQWPEQGIPANPRAWLVQVARHKAVDRHRRECRFEVLDDSHLATWAEEPDLLPEDIEDDRLRLVFTCCHPALDLQVRVALTLREVCGLTTEAIASAFLLQPATLAQRLVRGKAKIRAAGIPYTVPGPAELPERLEAVLTVIYLVYNEGYRIDAGPLLAEEAMRLCRLLLELLPEPEVQGLLALMLLHEARRPARLDVEGRLVLLEQQGRRLWRRDFIEEGKALLEAAFASRRIGIHTLQAAIAAVHADARDAATTDWQQIVALYDLLLQLDASPVIALNRVVALAMRDGAAAGLAQLEALRAEPALRNYHPLHVTHAELCRRAGRLEEARASYHQALGLVLQESERRHLEGRLAELSTSG